MSGIVRVDSRTLKRLLNAQKEITSKRLAHESDCIASLDYDLEESVCTAVFQKRGTYLYRDFPLDTYVDWSQSSSLGTYFNLYIRDQFTNFERIA